MSYNTMSLKQLIAVNDGRLNVLDASFSAQVTSVADDFATARSAVDTSFALVATSVAQDFVNARSAVDTSFALVAQDFVNARSAVDTSFALVEQDFATARSAVDTSFALVAQDFVNARSAVDTSFALVAQDFATTRSAVDTSFALVAQDFVNARSTVDTSFALVAQDFVNARSAVDTSFALVAQDFATTRSTVDTSFVQVITAIGGLTDQITAIIGTDASLNDLIQTNILDISANAALLASNEQALTALTTTANGNTSRIDTITTGFDASLNDIRSKMCFTHLLEFDGVLDPTNNPYPFSAGAGVPSSSTLGIPIPMRYKLLGYALMADIDLSANFVIESTTFSDDSSTTLFEPVYLANARHTNSFDVNSGPYDAGYVNIAVTSVDYNTSLVTTEAKYGRYRIALYFQSDNTFYTTP